MAISFWISIVEELKRAPIAALSGAANFIVAAAALAVAWLQFRAGSQQPASTLVHGASSAVGELHLANLSLNLAFFLGATVSASLAIRLIARRHELAALFTSIPVFALTNFFSVLVVYLAPPRPLSPQLFASAHDLIFYASAAILVAFCGQAMLREIASSPARQEKTAEAGEDKKDSDGFGALIFLLLLLALWAWLVFAGQTRLSRTLLPEIAHPPATQSAEPAKAQSKQPN